MQIPTPAPIKMTYFESILEYSIRISNRLFELSERYVGTGLSHSIPLVLKGKMLFIIFFSSLKNMIRTP
ncbi:hypothetical protein BpHYR1_002083 [Brachionus plicatilis]|uniref:Uncharacterized protein n=1 Tax=Brachionus plicatilis TaxID=10195 RepID=A0A3M7Q3K0_BRAPC|nr:hypothetical protein BpHYR1_002083 [Brachionus plicatilis]